MRILRRRTVYWRVSGDGGGLAGSARANIAMGPMSVGGEGRRRECKTFGKSRRADRYAGDRSDLRPLDRLNYAEASRISLRSAAIDRPMQ